MSLFPLFVDLNVSTGLIVGGGTVALRKAEKLQPFGITLKIIAPEILPDFSGFLHITCLCRAFEDADLDEAPALVIAATDDRELNRHISESCKARRIPVNVVDDPALCTFQFPALVQRGDLTVGISTAGKSPSAAAETAGTIGAVLPEEDGEWLDRMQRLRAELKNNGVGMAERSAILRRCWAYADVSRRFPDDALIQRWISGKSGSVALVGGGCGPEDLITLRGMRLLSSCDAVVYDALVAPRLLGLVPEKAEKIYAGKRAGISSAKQEEISGLLIRLAREGKSVVRLKGGDPYLFGRGSEEAQALEAAGIDWQEVPGIPSAIGIPAEAGIPVTHRGISRELHILTAHTADESPLPFDLPAVSRMEGTLVFLMGFAGLRQLADGLISSGKPADTPAAVIAGGCAPESYCIRGMLGTIAENVEKAGVHSPAVIVIGDCAGIRLNGSQADC